MPHSNRFSVLYLDDDADEPPSPPSAPRAPLAPSVGRAAPASLAGAVTARAASAALDPRTCGPLPSLGRGLPLDPRACGPLPSLGRSLPRPPTWSAVISAQQEASRRALAPRAAARAEAAAAAHVHALAGAEADARAAAVRGILRALRAEAEAAARSGDEARTARAQAACNAYFSASLHEGRTDVAPPPPAPPPPPLLAQPAARTSRGSPRTPPPAGPACGIGRLALCCAPPGERARVGGTAALDNKADHLDQKVRYALSGGCWSYSRAKSHVVFKRVLYAPHGGCLACGRADEPCAEHTAVQTVSLPTSPSDSRATANMLASLRGFDTQMSELAGACALCRRRVQGEDPATAHYFAALTGGGGDDELLLA